MFSFLIITLQFKLFQTEIRTSSGLNEEQWTKQFNEKLKKDFDFTHDLPSVFIDTFRNQKNPHEVNMFYQNTEKLWQFALNKIGRY